MATEQRMNLDQELAELTDLTTRTDWTLREIARVQEQLPKMLHDLRGYYAERRNASVARAEVEMLRGVGCGELREGAEVADGPCGVCLKCARRERDEARVEVARMKARPVEVQNSRLDGMWVQLVRERDAAYADRRDALAILARVAEQLGVSGEALAEDPTLVERRIVSLLVGLNAASRAEQERDEARAEIGRLRIENKFLRERPIPEGRIHQAMTGYVMDLRALVLDHEWVTDGRECLIYCLWCKQSESNGHAEACEMFGPGGLIPIDPKTRRPAPVKSLRERGCQCQWEAGDSPCPVHGEEAT